MEIFIVILQISNIQVTNFKIFNKISEISDFIDNISRSEGPLGEMHGKDGRTLSVTRSPMVSFLVGSSNASPLFRPQEIMFKILLIMLFQISPKNPSLCSLLFFMLLTVIIIP